MTTLKQSYKKATNLVSDLMPFGDNWMIQTWDNRCRAWRQSQPMPYARALRLRSESLIEEALVALGWDRPDAAYKAACYQGGGWRGYVSYCIV
jgi:hypothetical protein